MYPNKAHPVPASHIYSTPRCRFRLVTASAALSHSNIANALLRGSAFLKQWMEYLEEHADLRYPNLTDVYDEQ